VQRAAARASPDRAATAERAKILFISNPYRRAGKTYGSHVTWAMEKTEAVRAAESRFPKIRTVQGAEEAMSEASRGAQLAAEEEEKWASVRRAKEGDSELLGHLLRYLRSQPGSPEGSRTSAVREPSRLSYPGMPVKYETTLSRIEIAAFAYGGRRIGLVAAPGWGAMRTIKLMWEKAARCYSQGLHSLRRGDPSYPEYLVVPDFDAVPPEKRAWAETMAATPGVPYALRSRTEEGLRGLKDLDVVRLTGMTEEETAEQFAALDEKAGVRTPPELAEEVRRRTDGHPLWSALLHPWLHERTYGVPTYASGVRVFTKPPPLDTILSGHALSGRLRGGAPEALQRALAAVINPLHRRAELLDAARRIAGDGSPEEASVDQRREMLQCGFLIEEASPGGPRVPRMVRDTVAYLADHR
jgi:hypothetical protein